MARSDCVGEGAGWGTVEDTTLRVLLLAEPGRAATAAAIAASLGRHRTLILAEARRGPGAWLSAVRAAKSFDPHLIHALGTTGFAAAAGPVSAGVKRPLVVGYAEGDLDGPGLARAARAARRAHAVVLASEALVEPLRSRGVSRDVYVVTPPEAAVDPGFVGRALEVVYGRVLAAEEVELEHDVKAAPSYRLDAGSSGDAEPALVQIGGLRARAPQREDH